MSNTNSRQACGLQSNTHSAHSMRYDQDSPMMSNSLIALLALRSPFPRTLMTSSNNIVERMSIEEMLDNALALIDDNNEVVMNFVPEQ